MILPRVPLAHECIPYVIIPSLTHCVCFVFYPTVELWRRIRIFCRRFPYGTSSRTTSGALHWRIVGRTSRTGRCAFCRSVWTTCGVNWFLGAITWLTWFCTVSSVRSSPTSHELSSPDACSRRPLPDCSSPSIPYTPKLLLESLVRISDRHHNCSLGSTSLCYHLRPSTKTLVLQTPNFVFYQLHYIFIKFCINLKQLCSSCYFLVLKK